MTASLELIDFISFFEAEPTSIDEEVGWTCGAQFDSVRGESRIRAVVAPDDGEFSFKWWDQTGIRVDISLQGVVDWIFDCRPGKERLVLKLHQPGVEYFIVELKPHINVSCVVRWA